MANRGKRPSNELLLARLREGSASFELLQSPVPVAPVAVRFFARIGSSSRGGVSPATKKTERYTIQKVSGDGRCMFRALVKGMANDKGLTLSARQERDDADELRMAVKEIICDSDTERVQYEEALMAITVDESIKRYCQRIERSDFWGGESELLVLAELCQQPVIVYIPEHEHNSGAWGNGFIPISEYGSEFGKKLRNGKQRAPVRLLYSVLKVNSCEEIISQVLYHRHLYKCNNQEIYCYTTVVPPHSYAGMTSFAKNDHSANMYHTRFIDSCSSRSEAQLKLMDIGTFTGADARFPFSKLASSTSCEDIRTDEGDKCLILDPGKSCKHLQTSTQYV